MSDGARTLAASGRAGSLRAETTPLKLSVLLPRSGFLALIGEQCQRGADLAVPNLGDMGYTIELVNADMGSAQTSLRQLVPHQRRALGQGL